MHGHTSARLIVAAILLAGLPPHASVFGQSRAGRSRKPSAALPAPPPVSFVAAPDVLPPQTPQTPSQRPSRRAEISFAQGQLAVNADNASLNQILREIARLTGIKITGGVTDERVFGKYGPAPAAQVLSALLDGTSSNVLLLQSDSTSPGELILTPRQGGVTPPNPNAPGFDDEGSGDDEPPPQPQSQPQSQQPFTQPGAVPPTSTAPAAGPGRQPTPTPEPAGADPNAVKSPQQIYEQLQRLRQQQQAPPQ